MGTWPGISVLRGIVQVPFFRLEGTVCAEEGFDEASGFYGVARREERAVSPVRVIEDFARKRGSWTGTATELLAEEQEERSTAAVAVLGGLPACPGRLELIAVGAVGHARKLIYS